MGLRGPKQANSQPKAAQGQETPVEKAGVVRPPDSTSISMGRHAAAPNAMTPSVQEALVAAPGLGFLNEFMPNAHETLVQPPSQKDLAVMRIEPIITSWDDSKMVSKWIWQLPEWPRFTWDRAALVEPLTKAEGAQGRLRMLGQILDPRMTREALAEILKVEGISTSAIEGKHLDPASVAASVARHLGLPAPQGASVSRDSEGVVGVLMDATARFQEPLTEARLCGWQKALFPESRDQQGILVGALREGWVGVLSGVIGSERVHFEGVPAHTVKENLQGFIDWFNTPAEEPAVVRSGIAHLWLVTIHPFDDGNGRVTRAVTDLAMAQGEGRPDYLFRMSGRIEAVKRDYYAALNEAQLFEKGMDITPWLTWFVKQVAEACSGSEKIIQRTLAKATFWVRHRETDLNPHQRKAINRLLDSGPDGFEGGMTARKYAGLTHTSIPTATRHLTELLAMGCLVQRGGGRSTAYNIPWDALLDDR